MRSEPDQAEDEGPAPTSPPVAQPSCSQDTESTITLSCPSQDSVASDEVIPMRASVECQTDEVIFMSKEDYEKLVCKAAEVIDIKGDLEKLKTFFLTWDPQPPCDGSRSIPRYLYASWCC